MAASFTKGWPASFILAADRYRALEKRTGIRSEAEEEG